ncbi:Uncharacterized protein APZ42_011924 [Daphnia magna]|uniref:Uncharacterized protein n=1 Tax=Daphnia magna TaxID=35525 RepID=A0A162D883_9CRUS|nr:Uncharacterized protein APZ42_011924 [Daphnia magna]
MLRNLGGGSITSAVKRAWYRVFSIKVRALVNWKGMATKKYQKKGLKESIITKAVFEAVRNTGGRRAKDYEMEKLTKGIMRGMPEKYRNSLKASAEMEIDIEDDLSPPTRGRSL